MNFLLDFLPAGALIFTLMTLLWLLSLALKNASIVDVFWGLGFVLVAAGGVLLETTDHSGTRSGLVFLLVAVWGLRLALHILARNWGKPEDFRYAQWRQDHGPRWWWMSFFQVFLLQGFLMWLISAPILAAQSSRVDPPLGWLDGLGILAWAVGFLFEAAGDWQLNRFKARPENRGKILTTGVWRYTRHPNYFGDALQWWGFYLLAAAAGAWWTIFSPILMTFLLVRVSGVAMLERSLEQRPGYAEYARRTSAFIPWLPKRG